MKLTSKEDKQYFVVDIQQLTIIMTFTRLYVDQSDEYKKSGKPRKCRNHDPQTTRWRDGTRPFTRGG